MKDFPVIRLQGISKSFGEKKVLSDINLAVFRGEQVCIIGKSGCGKSVLANIMIGLLRPDTGKVFINNQDVTDAESDVWDRIFDDVGVVFQWGALFESLTVRENIAARLYEHHEEGEEVSEEEIVALVTRTLKKVGLDASIMESIPSELSGGMKKRVAIARAIAHSPHLIIYDEPTTGLDPVHCEIVDELIQELGKEGRTSIIITHDLATVQKIANRIIMLHEGNIHFDGTPQEFFKSEKPVIQTFLKRSHQPTAGA